MSRTVATREKLPKGWRKVKLKDFLSEPIKNGFSPICVSQPTSKKVLGLGALTGSGLKLDEIKWVSESNTEVDKFIIKRGDFLVSRSNTLDKVGRAAFYEGRLKNISYPDLMMKFRVDEKQIDPRFLELILQSSHARKHFMRHASGTSGSMVKITKSVVESLDVPLFPLDIQKSIANLVSTWKEAIEKTERLTAAKEKRFQWLLKKLISDQQDNPKWHKVKLGNLCTKILGGGTPSTANTSYWEGHIPWMTSADIADAKTIKARKYITTQAVTDSATSLIPKNNIIVVTRVGLGKAVKNEMDICISQDSQGLILKKSVSADFLIHCLLEKIQVFKSVSQGSTIQGITKKRLFDIKVSLPSLPQQKQIARQLDIVEREIGLLKQFAEKRRIQKHGLMQKLLTGKWRIKR